jgi:metal-responsive CopG/Arc/MetJ family transcriptional regulator
MHHLHLQLQHWKSHDCGGVDSMKAVVTSFSMSLLEAQALNAATRGLKNRSAWIVKACLDKISKEEDTQDALDRASVAELLSALHHKQAITHSMRWMIQNDWESKASRED